MNKLPLIKPFIKTNAFDKCVISSITDDSRDVQKNSLFVARQGMASHGKDFVKDAIRRGASCIISDQNFEDRIDIPIYCLNNLEDQILEILFRFYELSADNFIFHGVTGTNGKTTTAFMAHNIIRGLERPSIYIGTLGAFINDDLIQTSPSATSHTCCYKEISNILYEYGDEKASRKIAKAIVKYRAINSLETTIELTKVIETVLKRTSKTHPATKSFQAIRIHVNNELYYLKKALSKLHDVLKVGGVVVIISFHSLEDRIVKNFFKPEIKELPKDIPINAFVKQTYRCIKKKLKPSANEIKINPRSRSAVMRVFSKL